MSMLTPLSMTTSTSVLSVTDVFVGEGGGPAAAGFFSLKNKGVLKKWLNKLADALKRLSGKVVEVLSAIAGCVVGAILSFLDETVGFLPKHTKVMVDFVARLIGGMVDAKSKIVEMLLKFFFMTSGIMKTTFFYKSFKVNKC